MTSYQASAPGSLFIAGEHAVLVGYPALVATIDKQIHAKLELRSDREIHISSSFGELITSLDELSVVSPLQFVLTTIKKWHENHTILSGFNLHLTSEFSHKMGLGSSAAVSVVVTAVLAKWLMPAATKRDIFQHAYEVIKTVQGAGSGADVAASVFGGVIYYQLTPSITIDPLPVLLPIVLIYSGSKVPTPEVITKVQQQRNKSPDEYEKRFLQIGQYVEMACEACLMQDWSKLGYIFNCHQQLQADMNLSTPVIDDIINSLLSCQDIFGAKISGSGLGDGVIGLGSVPDDFFPATQVQRDAGVELVPVVLSGKGLM